MSNPQFLRKNFITDVDTLTLTENNSDVNKLRLFDRNISNVMQMADSGGVNKITWLPTVATVVNRIAWQASTIRNYTIEIDGVEVASSETNTDNNVYIELAEDKTVDIVNGLELIIDSFNGSNIQVGQLYIGTEIFEMANSTGGQVDLQAREKNVLLELSDGTIDKTYIRDFYNVEVDLTNITPAERLNYITLYNLNKRQTIVFVPNPMTSAWDGNLDHFNWINGFDLINRMLKINDNNFEGKLILRKANGK